MESLDLLNLELIYKFHSKNGNLINFMMKTVNFSLEKELKIRKNLILSIFNLKSANFLSVKEKL